MGKKKVLIDVSSTVDWFSRGYLNGIGRTTLELVKALDLLKDTVPFGMELYSQNLHGWGVRNIDSELNKHHLWLPKQERVDRYVRKVRMRELLTGYDVLHIPHNYDKVSHPERCVATIHDAMFFTYPEANFNPEFCRREYTKFAQQCRVVLTCSESSKRDIVEYMNIPESKVFVAPWGYKRDLFKPVDCKSSRPFFMSSSCDGGRKNTISLIRAFAIYAAKSKNHDLVLVWRNPPVEVMKELVSLGIEDRVTFARNISDEELAELYQKATATFFPSLYEGFGLPVLESMACGTPVVTCDNSSLGEVGGDAAIYVSETDVDEMTDAMLKFERMAQTDYLDLCKESIKQAEKFSWEDCALKTVEAYKYALNV